MKYISLFLRLRSTFIAFIATIICISFIVLSTNFLIGLYLLIGVSSLFLFNSPLSDISELTETEDFPAIVYYLGVVAFVVSGPFPFLAFKLLDEKFQFNFKCLLEIAFCIFSIFTMAFGETFMAYVVGIIFAIMSALSSEGDEKNTQEL